MCHLIINQKIMTNAKSQGLATLARAASVTLDTLSLLKKSIDSVMDEDMDILVHKEQPITDRQKEFLGNLIRKNIIDKGEREVKMGQIEDYSRADADMAIKQFLGE
jgi:hypothetical protein